MKDNVAIGQSLKKTTQRKIEDILAEYTAQWMSIPTVVGTAQGLDGDKPCIKVYVSERTPETNKKIPKSIEGYSVIVEVTGAFEPRK